MGWRRNRDTSFWRAGRVGNGSTCHAECVRLNLWFYEAERSRLWSMMPALSAGV